MELRDPGLYAPAGTGDAAHLLAMRDPATGALAFPRTGYGIGATGLPAEQAEMVVLSGRAAVLASVTIHQPLSPGMRVPLCVARLRLAEGLVLDGVLETPEEPPVGAQVQAVLVPEGERLTCRFRLLENPA